MRDRSKTDVPLAWRVTGKMNETPTVALLLDRLHTLIPRETLRWKALYRRRASVERAFYRLKNHSALAPCECVESSV